MRPSSSLALACLPVAFRSPRPCVVAIAALALFALGGCSNPKKIIRCYTAADCAPNEVCSELTSGARTCLDACDVSEAATCATGAACVTIGGEDAQVDVCLPGGATVLGATCATSVECVSGAVCVQRAGQPTPRCEKLCTTDGAAVCVGNEACTPIDAAVSATRGTCIIPGT